MDGHAPGVDRHGLAVQIEVDRVGMPPGPLFCFQHGNIDVLRRGQMPSSACPNTFALNQASSQVFDKIVILTVNKNIETSCGWDKGRGGTRVDTRASVRVPASVARSATRAGRRVARSATRAAGMLRATRAADVLAPHGGPGGLSEAKKM